MSPRALLAASVLASTLLAPPLVARADVPPPEGYVESCTVERQSRNDRECKACNTYYGNPPNHCAEEVGAGFAQACRTRGASVWTEVWCRDVPPGTAPTPPRDESSGATQAQAPAPPPAQRSSRNCSTATPLDALLPGAMLGLALVLGRRRSR